MVLDMEIRATESIFAKGRSGNEWLRFSSNNLKRFLKKRITMHAERKQAQRSKKIGNEFIALPKKIINALGKLRPLHFIIRKNTFA